MESDYVSDPRNSYRYGPEDWQVLTGILREYSAKLIELFKNILRLKARARRQVSYVAAFILAAFTPLIMSILALFYSEHLEEIFLSKFNTEARSYIILACLIWIFLCFFVAIDLEFFTLKRNSDYSSVTINQDTRLMASRLESAVKLTVTVSDQVELSLAKKLEMDLLIDEATSALQYYYSVVKVSKPKRPHPFTRTIIAHYRKYLDLL
jgi:hypothetical protein